MPKKVKTRKQKMLSDSRRKLHASIVQGAEFPTYSLPQQKSGAETVSIPVHTGKLANHTPTSGHVSTTGYQYLLKDLRKTLLLTLSIIAAQMLISYLVR